MTFTELVRNIESTFGDIRFDRQDETTIRFYPYKQGDFKADQDIRKAMLTEFIHTNGGVITSRPNCYCVTAEFKFDDEISKSYKCFQKIYIGDSDISALTVRTAGGVYDLRFGGDSAYHAYLCEGNVDIGDHYHAVFTGDTWLKIYDDSGLVVNLSEVGGYRKFTIYRSGEYGCIIHWHKADA